VDALRVGEASAGSKLASRIGPERGFKEGRPSPAVLEKTSGKRELLVTDIRE
jgi:hypothetical protein